MISKTEIFVWGMIVIICLGIGVQIFIKVQPVVKKIDETHQWATIEKTVKEKQIKSFKEDIKNLEEEIDEDWEYVEERCVCLLYQGWGNDNGPKTKEEICNYQPPQDEYSTDLQTYWVPEEDK